MQKGYAEVEVIMLGKTSDLSFMHLLRLSINDNSSYRSRQSLGLEKSVARFGSILLSCNTTLELITWYLRVAQLVFTCFFFCFWTGCKFYYGYVSGWQLVCEGCFRVKDWPVRVRQTPEPRRGASVCASVSVWVTGEWTETVKSAHSALDIFPKRILNCAPLWGVYGCGRGGVEGCEFLSWGALQLALKAQMKGKPLHVLAQQWHSQRRNASQSSDIDICRLVWGCRVPVAGWRVAGCGSPGETVARVRRPLVKQLK